MNEAQTHREGRPNGGVNAIVVTNILLYPGTLKGVLLRVVGVNVGNKILLRI